MASILMMRALKDNVDFPGYRRVFIDLSRTTGALNTEIPSAIDTLALLTHELSEYSSRETPSGVLLMGFFTGDDITPFDHAITQGWGFYVHPVREGRFHGAIIQCPEG